MTTTRGIRPLRLLVATLAAGAVLLSAGCSSSDKPAWEGGSANGSPAEGTPPPPESTVSVTSPESGAKDVEAVTPVAFESDDPEKTTVTVKDDDGKEAPGKLDTGAKTWTPTKALSYATTYTVTVDGPASGDKVGTTTSTFTTMKKPSKLVRVSSFLGDGNVVGTAMPMIIKFGRAIPEKNRADVQRRMTVEATPAQEGTWHWISPTEVHYRPKSFWEPGTKVFTRIALAGVPMGSGWYGRSDLTVDVKIGRSFVMTVDNKTKQMTVKQGGKTIKTIPVSLGAPKTPSSSGTMVVIEKKRHTVFDTMDELPAGEGYRTEIDYAQRITWSGQFIHAAPWSEGKQGRVNVSHGCVNVSEAMGAWLFARTMMGDPITVKGTEEKLKQGNGWTDWDMSWDEYKKGSAI